MTAQGSKSERWSKLALPARSDAVTIVRPSGERLQAHVAECDGASLLVALAAHLEQPFQQERLDQLALEFTTRRGRIRIHGAVALEQRELLRFASLNAVEVLQERDFVRVPATRPVLVSAHAGHGPIQTYCVNLSGGGMLLAGPDTLQIGERIQFRLTTAPGRGHIDGRGTVVRTDAQGRRVICFDEIGEGDHRRLVRFVFECERIERRRELERGRGNGH